VSETLTKEDLDRIEFVLSKWGTNERDLRGRGYAIQNHAGVVHAEKANLLQLVTLARSNPPALLAAAKALAEAAEEITHITDCECESYTKCERCRLTAALRQYDAAG